MRGPLVFATRNPGKLVELRALLPGVDVLSIDEAEARLGRAGDAANNLKLLEELDGVPADRRTARFRSVLAIADPAGALGTDVITADGVAEGVVLDAPRGTGGFGYDPLFYFPPLGATFAELGVGPKNDLSHRARAMRALVPRLLAYLHG
jgi:XTP/dITP diphosphohydrolase